MPLVDQLDAAARRVRALLESLAFLAPLATRVVIGLVFLHTGSGKWAHFDRTVAFFTELGIPAARANAAFIATLEMVGGVALIAGVLTRVFAFLLSCTMVVALMTADRADFLASWGSASDKSPTDIVSFVFLLFLAWLVLYGPGRASIDHLVRRAWDARRPMTRSRLGHDVQQDQRKTAA